MQIIQGLDVPVQFQRSALPLRLLYAQTREIILEFSIDELE